MLIALHWALVASSQVNDLTWHSFGIEQGLSEATNVFVFKDSRGFVWISSVSGLNRYDGTSVKVYRNDEADPSTLSNDIIQSSFFEDAQKNLWFTTHEAIQKYNFDSDCFDHYQVYDDHGHPRNSYYIFHLDPDQYLWLLVEFRMLYTFHIPTGTMEYHGDIEHYSVRCFNVTDEDGYLKRILVRGRDWPGILVVDVNKDHCISGPNWLSTTEEMMVSSLRPILTEGDSLYWILRPQAILKYHVHSGRITTFPSAVQMNCMTRYDDSTFIIGTPSDGLFLFQSNTGRYTLSRGVNGPLDANGHLLRINYIAKDTDGTIWTSTDGIGLSYARPEKRKFATIRFSDFSLENPEIKPIQIFEYGHNQLLCFTEYDGTFLIKDAIGQVIIELFDPLKSIHHLRINTVNKDLAGRYWINTWSGIYVYEPSANKLTQVTDASKIGLSSDVSPDGCVYYSLILNGLFETHMENGIPVIKTVDPRFDQKLIYPLFFDHLDRMWIMNDQKAFEIYDTPAFRLLGTQPIEGIFNAMVESKDGNTIFFGGYSGLCEIDNTTLLLRKMHTESSGFPATSIFSMLRDDHGKIWMGHTKGIASYDPETGKAQRYNHEDGLPLAAYTTSACSLASGYLCFGNIGGFTIFHPDSVKPIHTIAIPQFSSLLLNDKVPEHPLLCEDTGVSHFEDMQRINLSYKHNTMSFRIHALEYSAPEFNKVVYQMEGLDDHFIEGRNGDRLRYPSMSPGAYRFVMYAFNSDGVRNPLPRVLEINIQPPYYKTWWFISLMALAALTIVGYIFYLRFSKRLELQRVRLKLYENLHDDVGSRLTAIVLSAEDLERNEHISHPKITSISQIARSIVGNMRRLVWAIDPENDRMTSIVQKITHDKSQILDDQIEFSIQVDPGLRNVILPGEFRYQISSICNESFNNISKYAHATHVSVTISRENKNILLTVKDNGKGFDPEAAQKNELTGSGYGLSNMHRRASRIGGSFRIISAPGQGTQTEFRFPYKG